ncbi:MAG: DNA-directed RNA polymerase subunit alpha [Elusimicrobiota bacterium]
MKFRDFQLPRDIDWLEKDEGYGKFSCQPFERGYGHTVGNSLRRILLASLEGAAITSVKVDGVLHEYSTIDGVKEDVLEIIFNLKDLNFKVYTEHEQTVTLEVQGEKVVTGDDFKLNQSVDLLNPDKKIATLDDKAELKIEAEVSRGRGYSPGEERKDDINSPGVIPVDASFSPIKKVNYDVENARVGQTTDYDKLIMEIWTDGGVSPEEAVAYAAEIMIDTMTIFRIDQVEEVELGEDVDRVQDKINKLKRLPVNELKLSTRVVNALKASEINTIGDILAYTRSALSEVDKIGKKAMEEIGSKLSEIEKENEVPLEFSEEE